MKIGGVLGFSGKVAKVVSKAPKGVFQAIEDVYDSGQKTYRGVKEAAPSKRFSTFGYHLQEIAKNLWRFLTAISQPVRSGLRRFYFFWKEEVKSLAKKRG